jgi:two-component system chemotaxis sensor kinase CheA
MNNLEQQFAHDSREFLIELENLFVKLESEPSDRNIVHAAFRTVHSLKSEAAHLGKIEVSQYAERIESILEELRVGNRSVDRSTIDSLLLHLDRIDSKLGGEKSQSGTLSEFTALEQLLVREALERGEQIYKVYLVLKSDEQMLHPRFFLVVSKLEEQANVISTNPELHENIQSTRIEIILSTSLAEAELKALISVDGIETIELHPLKFNEENKKVQEEVEPDDRYVRVSQDRFDQMEAILSEIQYQLSKDFTPDTYNQLRSSMHNLGNALKDMRKVRVKEIHEKLKRLVRDYGLKEGKQVRLQFHGDNTEVDQRIYGIINEIVTQLVRNAVVHGIENPAERISKGKSDDGTIEVSIWEDQSRIGLQVSDDGRGIDREALFEKAREKGIVVKPNQDELSILCAPGFSTKTTQNSLAGRGVGLDLVKRRVEQAGGSLLLETENGVSFSVFVSKGSFPIELTIVKMEGDHIALDSRYFQKRDEKSFIQRYQADEQILYIDEIEYSLKIPSSQFVLGDEIRPNLFRVLISSGLQRFYYLRPDYSQID